MWDDSRPYAPLRVNGLGGTGPLGRTVRADRFAFAGLTVERPLVMLAGAKTGYALEDGIIGLAMLRRFNLSIDSKAQSLWVQQNQQPVVDRENYPLSGIWLERHGDAIVADAVGMGSPAAKSGVRPGDRIVGLDLAAAIRMLNGPAGSEVPLTIERAGVRRSVTLALSPYL